MDETRQVFGIDLGTTYSCVAQVEFDLPVVRKNFEGLNTTPSVVYFESDNKVIVGEGAKEMLKLEPERTIAFIKREISKDEAYEPGKFPAGADPTIISAHILKKIVKDANDAAQNPEPITKVVITCPAYFGTKERMRTKQAGEAAGLEVLAVINEPTAAAISYGIKLEENKTLLVYDLGGGTFDVTVIRVADKTLTVIATDGNHHLGGYDWDRAIAKYMLNEFNKQHGTSYDMDSDKKISNAFMMEAEAKKKQLSARDSVNFIITLEDEGKSFKAPLTRQMFNDLTEDLLDETISKTKDVIKIANEKGLGKIDEILLVGGSSKMPQIKARVDEELGCSAKLTDPDECVAKGAAIYALNAAFAAAMNDYANGDIDDKPQSIGNKSQVRVVNVTSKNYGTDIVDSNGNEMVSQLIFANTSLNNCRAEDTFNTIKENQSGVSMKIFESDVAEKVISPNAAALLEDHSMPFTKPYPKGTPIKVVFAVDEEGILHVHAEVNNEPPFDVKIKLKGVKDETELQTAKMQVANTTVE